MVIKNSMNSMAIIPARLGSTRLKNKPLQLINNTPLIKLVTDEVLKTGLFDLVVVATDAEEIIDLFKDSESVKAVMTGVHESGTDRINEAAEIALKEFSASSEIVLNIQGDEPFIYKEDLEKLLLKLKEGYKMASLYEEISAEDLDNPNKVKVILNEKTEAIYFSRFPIPFSRGEKKPRLKSMGKHVGVYAYKKSFLKDFCDKPVSFLEAGEKLEQLRALEIGEKISMVYTSNSYKGVDTSDDLKEVEEILKNKINNQNKNKNSSDVEV